MKKFGWLSKTAYGIGNLGYGTLSQALNSFVMFFATAVLGMRGSLVGIAVGISALWDGVSDPIIGYISDRSSNKGLGKRLRFMFIASLAMAISNFFLWIIPPAAPVVVKFIWLLVCLLLVETACTLFATPYFALGVDLAPDYTQQNLVQGFKTVFFILGMILPSILMMVFMPTESGNQAQFQQANYVNIGLVTSTLALVCGLISTFGTLKAYKQIEFSEKFEKSKKNSFLETLKKFFKVLKQKNYFSVIIGYSVALLSSAFLISVGMHLFTYAYHFSSRQIPILMTVLFVSAILSQPFWIYLANRGEKKRALNASLITILFGLGLTAITFIFRDFVVNQTLFFITLPCIFICGFGTGSLYSLPLSMFADVLTMDKIKTGENNSATYSGFMTISYNIANSLALLIIGFLLDYIKFDASQPVQPLNVQNNLGMIVFLGCACSISLSMLFFSKYSLKRKDILKAQMNSEIKVLTDQITIETNSKTAPSILKRKSAKSQ